MIKRTVGALTIALFVLTAAGSGSAMDERAGVRVIDLTYTFDSRTIYWPTEKPFVHQSEHFGLTPEGYFYSSAKFAAPEHGGTHMDAPIHFSRGGATADKVPLADCIGPAAVIDFSERAANDRDATLDLDDIANYERAYGPIPDGAIVVARSGWGKYWPDKKRYLGTDKPKDVAHLRFPGFSPEAIAFLIENRRVSAIAIDTPSIDPGNSTDFPVHQMWLGHNKPAFENVANADKLPPVGATLFCIPMKIGDGTGGPTRIFALLPQI